MTEDEELQGESSEQEEEPSKYVVEVYKTSAKQLNEDKINYQLNYIKERLIGPRSKKWEIKSSNTFYKFDGMKRMHRYTCKIELEPLRPGKETPYEFLLINNKIAVKAASSQRWTVDILDEETPNFEGKPEVAITIEENWREDFFSHIYGRNDQIDVVMSAIEALEISEGENRYHCVLHGPPACGKTEISRAFKTMLGEDAVLEYDATSTTQAGAIRDLNEREMMPKVLIVEEIEKTDENSLRWMLSILDHRAEIRKTNYREQIQKSVKLICIATVNDYKLFKSLMYGALASRFTHHLYCPRPDAEILRMILTREIDKIQSGKTEWIDPAIEFAELIGETDPRKVTAICLCGRDELLDGTYQQKLLKCMQPEDREKYAAKRAAPELAGRLKF